VPATIAILGIALAFLLIVLMRLYAYKATHPHTGADLERARQQSVMASRAIVTGQVTEHLLPLLPEWPYNPRDAKFLGQPVDFVVFEGLSENVVDRVVFVEVKTGKSGRLSPRERSLREAIQAGRVAYEVIKMGGSKEPAPPTPLAPRSALDLEDRAVPLPPRAQPLG
jgi:hypothetical protein